jgi:hypothetical protein
MNVIHKASIFEIIIQLKNLCITNRLHQNKTLPGRPQRAGRGLLWVWIP